MKIRYLSCLCFFLLFLLILPGCTKEDVYRGVYKGMQQREEIVHPSNDPIPPEQPSYEEYRREREEALKEE